MKFTDGFWVIKPGFDLFNCAQVVDSRWDGERYQLYCSHKEQQNRGETLNAPLITLSIRAPHPETLALKLTHFAGSLDSGPEFQLYEQASCLRVVEDDERICISSGELSAVIRRNPFKLDFFQAGVRMTGLGARHMGYVSAAEGGYMRVKLDVAVGEKLYGLGERFTPFVKNGQTVDIWNEDGGTASELAYKNIPFYVSNRGYGVFVNSPGRVSYELCSEAVQSAQFSLPGESMEFMVIGGGTIKSVVRNYTALTGRPALPPAWSFGLWLTTSFTTEYNEQTILSFVDGMSDRDIPLHVFHFDCFWMKAYEWCSFEWDKQAFPDPVGLLRVLKERGLKTCVWINPYIGQKAPIFKEAMERGYLLKRRDGSVWQWNMWQAGMGIVDFTNPAACAWYEGKLKALLDMGVDCFKTDFGERIPTDCVYFDGSNPELMHNYYAQLYNKLVFDLLVRERGEGEACLFARSATVGGQQYPVHWGGDSSSNFPSMAESLRAGLSLCLSGFAFWSHDISGFEDTASPEVYMRWAQFGMLSSHSRLHGSRSYRVPWLFGEQATDVLRAFTRLKCRLMPYLYGLAVEAQQEGLPLMRAMVMEFPGNRACEELDRQYMLGDSILVAPVFDDEGRCEYYLPKGRWTHLLSNEEVEGGDWRAEQFAHDTLPLYQRENSILPLGMHESKVDYNYLEGLKLRVCNVSEQGCERFLVDSRGRHLIRVVASLVDSDLDLTVEGAHLGVDFLIFQGGEQRTIHLDADQQQLKVKVHA